MPTATESTVGAPKVCLVTSSPAYEKLLKWSIQSRGLQFDFQIADHLPDLLAIEGCVAVIVDAKARDLDQWPAVTARLDTERPPHWLLLVETLRDAELFRPMPENFALFPRRRKSLPDLGEYLAKVLDPEARKRIEKVTYSAETNAFVVRLGNGRSYALKLDDLPEYNGSGVKRVSVARSRRYFRVVQRSGKVFEVPWDDVLYHCEPGYEFYKGKAAAGIRTRSARIARRVRLLRSRRGMSTAELARRAGMHRPNLSRLEAGRHEPSLDILEKVANALGVPVADLVAA